MESVATELRRAFQRTREAHPLMLGIGLCLPRGCGPRRWCARYFCAATRARGAGSTSQVRPRMRRARCGLYLAGEPSKAAREVRALPRSLAVTGTGSRHWQAGTAAVWPAERLRAAPSRWLPHPSRCLPPPPGRCRAATLDARTVTQRPWQIPSDALAAGDWQR